MQKSIESATSYEQNFPLHDAKIEDTSQIILLEFEKQMTVSGIKETVMAHLATKLGISTKTLYRHFHSKDELVGALFSMWSERLIHEQQNRILHIANPVERVTAGALTINEYVNYFSMQFWVELLQDYPHHHATLMNTMQDMSKRTAVWMTPLLQTKSDAEYCVAALQELIRWASQPQTTKQFGIDQRESIIRAVHVWAQGVFQKEHVQKQIDESTQPD